MYSIVLLTAMATQVTVPAHGHMYGGYYGGSCYGCCGGGYGCGGCYGGGCYGCGGCYGGYAPYSSYSGYSGYSGYSSCYGCCGGCGGYVPHYGCYGVAYGYHGGCYGAYGNWQGGDVHSGGCFGCHGGQSGYGIPLPIPDTRVAPIAVDPFPPINPPAKDKKVGPAKDEEEIGVPPEKKAPIKPKAPDPKPEQQVRVTVLIDIPQDGRLFVDNVAVTGTGSRSFQTPPLTMGVKYFYDLRIEIERNGQRLGETRRVVIEPGRDLAVSFQNLAPTGTTTAQAEE